MVFTVVTLKVKLSCNVFHAVCTEIVHQKVCLGTHCTPYVVPHNILTHVSNKGYFNNPFYFIVLFSSFYFEFSESWCIGLSEASSTAKKLVIA